MTDDVGVLSFYTTADPHEEGGRPAWQTRARTCLRQLPEQVKAQRSRGDWLAVKARLDSLSAEFEQVLNVRSPGIGRALFAPVSDSAAEVISVQVPLVDKVEIAPMAQLRPLVAAWSAAGPAGAISVGPDEVRVIELRLGRAEHVATIEHPDDPADRRDMKGPAHGSPAMTQQSNPQIDRFDGREEYRLHRYLRTLGHTIVQLASESAWEYLAITGDISLAQALAGGLPHAFQPEVVLLPHPVSSTTTTHQLAELVKPALANARHQRDQRLAKQARDAALASNMGPGAIGLSPTLGALQQGQVANLLMSHNGTWTGVRTSDGTLIAGHDQSNGFVSEPHLDEHMIMMAVHYGATVTIMDDTDAAPLGDERIGAILRWSAA
jgi:hypothetical protein